MQSLRGILSTSPTVLLIDSASAVIQVGILRAGSEPFWETSGDEAGVGVFGATETVLRRAGGSLGAIDAFVFCEGPGSVLGIRTAAVALRTWNAIRARPVFAFRSLELVANFQLQRRTGPFSVIADARRDSWHVIAASASGATSPLRRAVAAELTGTLLMPQSFRHWSPPPEGVEIVPYQLSVMLEALRDAPLLSETSEPDAFLHEAPSYQTWTPQVHRAPLP